MLTCSQEIFFFFFFYTVINPTVFASPNSTQIHILMQMWLLDIIHPLLFTTVIPIVTIHTRAHTHTGTIAYVLFSAASNTAHCQTPTHEYINIMYTL